MTQDMLLTVDYHDQTCVVRRFAGRTAEETVESVPTTPEDLTAVVTRAWAQAGRRGRVIWLQESTTGWARVQELLGERVAFLLANVVQLPRPPKGHRRK